MPRVTFVKAARKDNKAAGIKKGDSYYHWSMMVGGRGHKRYSKTQPKRSQLTNSEFLSSMYDAEDHLQTCLNSGEVTKEDILGYITDCMEQVEEAKSDCEEKQGNLEQAFPNGCPTLELIESRIESCDTIISDLENLRDEVESYEPEEGKEESTDDLVDLCGNISWDYE